MPETFCVYCFEPLQEGVKCSRCAHNAKESNEGQGLPTGILLGKRYLLGKVLGQGGFGITYLAWDLELKIKLAIKEYLPRDFVSRSKGKKDVSIYTGDASLYFEDGLNKFLEEARILARFEDYPNIVSVRDFFRENGTAYLVMNYLAGITLKEYLQQRNNRLSYQKTLEIMMPAMDALDKVHDVGILHRDISPDNIFITSEGMVKILDFGAARHALGEHSKSLSVVLKPGYAPEEQYRSQGKQGPWTDIYALAATMYRMLCAQVPAESLDRMAGEVLMLPSQIAFDLPMEFDSVLMKALELKAENRYQSISEFQQALLSIDTAKSMLSLGISNAELLNIEKSDKEILADSGVKDLADKAYIENTGSKGNIKRKIWAGLLVIATVAILIIIYRAVFSDGYEAYSTYTFPDGRQYSGEMRNGLPDGWGECKIPTEGTYTGAWQEGKEFGEQNYKGYSGETYIGEMLDGKAHGQGKKTFPDGSNYIGSFKNKLIHGQGIYTWADGTEYEGEFLNGEMHGQGILKSSGGSEYDGNFKAGKKHGQGVFRWSDGDEYIGIFTEDLITGKGTMKYNDGNKYIGDFVDGVRNGKGEYLWPNGDKYTGDFIKGNMHGRGSLIYADGSKMEGRWENNNFIGK